VFISGQKRGVFGVIKRELKRRSAIEAVIGHNLVLAWLRAFLRLILHTLFQALATPSPLKPAC
jgi:hypothetical protein